MVTTSEDRIYTNYDCDYGGDVGDVGDDDHDDDDHDDDDDDADADDDDDDDDDCDDDCDDASAKDIKGLLACFKVTYCQDVLRWSLYRDVSAFSYCSWALALGLPTLQPSMSNKEGEEFEVEVAHLIYLEGTVWLCGVSGMQVSWG